MKMAKMITALGVVALLLIHAQSLNDDMIEIKEDLSHTPDLTMDQTALGESREPKINNDETASLVQEAESTNKARRSPNKLGEKMGTGAFECASGEGQTCTCTGTVYYGRKFVNGSPGSGSLASLAQMKTTGYTEKAVSGSIGCSNSAMGGDPLGGYYKYCLCVAAAAVSTTPPGEVQWTKAASATIVAGGSDCVNTGGTTAGATNTAATQTPSEISLSAEDMQGAYTMDLDGDQNHMVPARWFGVPTECANSGHTGPECCPWDTIHTDVSGVRAGFDAQVLASVVTFGNARDKDGDPLAINQAALFLVKPHKDYFDPSKFSLSTFDERQMNPGGVYNHLCNGGNACDGDCDPATPCGRSDVISTCPRTADGKIYAGWWMGTPAAACGEPTYNYRGWRPCYPGQCDNTDGCDTSNCYGGLYASVSSSYLTFAYGHHLIQPQGMPRGGFAQVWAAAVSSMEFSDALIARGPNFELSGFTTAQWENDMANNPDKDYFTPFFEDFRKLYEDLNVRTSAQTWPHTEWSKYGPKTLWLGRRTSQNVPHIGGDNWPMGGAESWVPVMSGMSFIKGLQFRVTKSSNEQSQIRVWQTSDDWVSSSGTNFQNCGASVTWIPKVCKGCCCTGGVMDMSIATEQIGTQSGCAEWFVAVDTLFRKYFGMMRAQILVVKTVCCDPGRTHSPYEPTWGARGFVNNHWDHDICNNERIGAGVCTPTSKAAVRKKRAIEELIEEDSGQTKADALTGTHAEMGKVIGASPSSSEELIGADQAQVLNSDKARRSPINKLGENMGTGYDSLHYRDVTDDQLELMELSCKYHAHAGADTLSQTRDDAFGGLGSWNDLDDEHTRTKADGTVLDFKQLGGRPELYGKMVCVEPDYPKAAQVAFSPTGNHFFPPKVSKPAGTSKKLELSCGYEEVHLDMFDANVVNGGTPLWTQCEEGTCLDKNDNNVKGKMGMFHLDGGKLTNQYHRPANSGFTTTCCPPKGLANYKKNTNNRWDKNALKPNPGRNWAGMAPTNKNQRVVITVKRPPHEANHFPPADVTITDTLITAQFGPEQGGDDEACFRWMYDGETEQCKSELTLDIQMCDCRPAAEGGLGPLSVSSGDRCKNANGQYELVKMTISHELQTPATDVDGNTDLAHRACAPWFTAQDAGIRSYIAKYRQQVNDLAIQECL